MGEWVSGCVWVARFHAGSVRKPCQCNRPLAAHTHTHTHECHALLSVKWSPGVSLNITHDVDDDRHELLWAQRPVLVRVERVEGKHAALRKGLALEVRLELIGHQRHHLRGDLRFRGQTLDRLHDTDVLDQVEELGAVDEAVAVLVEYHVNEFQTLLRRERVSGPERSEKVIEHGQQLVLVELAVLVHVEGVETLHARVDERRTGELGQQLRRDLCAHLLGNLALRVGRRGRDVDDLLRLGSRLDDVHHGDELNQVEPFGAVDRAVTVLVEHHG